MFASRNRPFYYSTTFSYCKGIKRNYMKICAIICEYNPFHNGHLFQLQEAKRLSGADALLCLMSGNFVQRGEAAILEKKIRAKHALQAGADIVLELPTPFATSNAEIFAKGAVHILSSIPAVTHLAFGCETANKTAIKLAAKSLNSEPKEVSERIKQAVSQGKSYAKARTDAWAGFIDIDLLCSPNNILALEYTRALYEKDSSIDILPIKRIGGGYHDADLQGEYSSATAIREGIKSGADFEKSLPDFVKKDVPKSLENNLDCLEKYAVITTEVKDLKKVCDCTEGLENAFKKAATLSKSFAESLTSARYTSSRIRRIALQNLLKIEENLIRESLQSPLYLRVLGVKKERSEVLAALSQSSFPLLVRAHDEDGLTGTAKKCYEADIFAEKIYAIVYEKK